MTEAGTKLVHAAITETAFHCPYSKCGAFAKQQWHVATSVYMKGAPVTETPRPSVAAVGPQLMASQPETRAISAAMQSHFRLGGIHVSECTHCHRLALWVQDKMVWPVHGTAPSPNPDLSGDIRRDYEEASNILDLSPRGAAALLRLAIQKLCAELGAAGDNINKDIAFLVSNKGLDETVQQALDFVRVVGNNAVHPGQIDLKDDKATASMLFGLVNLIADETISRKKRVSAAYSKLPPEIRAAIDKRDGRT